MEAWFYHRIKNNKDVIMTFYLANLSLYITMLTYEKQLRKRQEKRAELWDKNLEYNPVLRKKARIPKKSLNYDIKKIIPW